MGTFEHRCFCSSSTTTRCLTDRPIDWNGIVRTLDGNWCDLVRFAVDDGRKPGCERGRVITPWGVPLIKTIQYLGLPHVARTDFYFDFLKNFREAKIHLECSESDLHFSNDNWNHFRMCIYNPSPLIERCYTLSGRSDSTGYAGPKLPMAF